MIVETLEIPPLPGESDEEELRIWHDAAHLYLGRALDGRRTARHAALAASCLRRLLGHPSVAVSPVARAILRHDLGVAALLAAEVARGEREAKLLRRAVAHLQAATQVAVAAGPPRFCGLALHNYGYAQERLAAVEGNAREAQAGAQRIHQARLILRRDRATA